MAFNIALSGLNAASSELDVKGNNIANSSTTGFKRSRAEFGDLFSSGLASLGSAGVGEGVRLQQTRQLFQQGNITQTDNGLDMAINGEGFFVLNNGGEDQFTRAGEFGVDNEGFITTNQGARLQGFQPDDNGNVGDVRGDLEVNTENLKPKRTTNVDANVNLDAREPFLREEFTTAVAGGAAMGTVSTAPTSDFSAAQFEVRDAEGNLLNTVGTPEGNARAIADELNQQDGLRVSATTQATISSLNVTGPDNTVTVGTKTYDLDDGASLEDLAEKIDADRPPGITLGLNDTSDELTLTDGQGGNINISLNNTGTGNSSLDVEGEDDEPAEELATGATEQGTVRGVLDFRVEEGFRIEQTTVNGDDDDGQFLTEEIDGTNLPNPSEKFDPNDPDTFNHSTSSTIFDSLGNEHQLTQFFVKQAPSAANTWSMFVQIDGADVGPPGNNEEPTQAEFAVEFSENGSLEFVTDISEGAGNADNTEDASKALIKNWTPQETDEEPNGAAGPNPEGPIAIPDPPESSNFVIDLGKTTQTGSEFTVNNLQQNGFATGRLTGLDVSNEGIIQGLFSNGESEAIGQVALATFPDNNGLQTIGDTNFGQTFESGDATIGRPGNGPRGSIQASSLEESNVDLSEQLVGLITAQRNFQANSQTIDTADTITQTIINL